MSEILIPGGASGAGSDDCTATANDVIKGKTAIVSGSDDEPVVGTLALSGNATAAFVYTGKTFYSTDPKTKLTGTMTVNSILSFSAQAYSGRQILLKWQNPYAATGRPFTGVNIAYSTGGYPPDGGGTWLWMGCGNNTASGGWSQVLVTLPNLNTTYYFNANAYVNTSNGTLWGPHLHATATTSGVIIKTFTASTSYTIPSGFSKMDLFVAGAGSSGSSSKYRTNGGSGGGGGYTKTVKGITISSGEVLNIAIGSGGSGTTGTISTSPWSNFIGNAGGISSVTRNGTTLILAAGGTNNKSTNNTTVSMDEYGKNGGSGGGGGSSIQDNDDGKHGRMYGNAGGSDGSDGKPSRHWSSDSTAIGRAGSGQGTTTKAFGESTGALYGSGGGGSRITYNVREESVWLGTIAGGPGAGAGGTIYYDNFAQNSRGTNGNANSGGGGGGSPYYMAGGNGGSGVVLIRLY